MSDRGNKRLRWLDKWIGIPLVFFLGFFRLRKRKVPSKIQSIGVLATAAIGDTILLSAFIKELNEGYSQCRITLFCGSSNLAMARIACPLVDIQEISVKNPLTALKTISKQGPFDCWIDTGPWPRLNSVLSALTRSSFKIGFKSPGQGRHFVYDKWLLHSRDCHELQNIHQLGSPLGLKGMEQPDLTPMLKAVLPRISHEKYLLFHMFPGGYLSHYKEWNRKNWIELIDHYSSQGWTIVLSGAPVDQERAQDCLNHCRNQEKLINAAGKYNLELTGRLIQDAQAVVSVNTGIMHYAAALKMPMVALHGPTSALRWGPVNDRAINLEATSPWAGCLHLGFEYHLEEDNSMDSIEIKSVTDALDKCLSNKSGLE